MFAEDYDDHMDETPAPEVESKVEKEDDSPPKNLVHEASACPNLTNRYHECTDYCREKYGYKQFTPIESLENKRAKMLLKYPLPADWMEVGDPDTYVL